MSRTPPSKPLIFQNEVDKRISDLQRDLWELKLDVSLLHLGEAAASILDEGSGPSTESSTHRKSTSPRQKTHMSKKNRAAEELSNAEHKDFLEIMRNRRNTTAHAAKDHMYE